MEKLTALVLCALLCAASACAEDLIPLPAPQKSGGPELLAAIDRRASAPGSAFPKGDLSTGDVSTLLWAASGHNRDGRLWTVPMAMGRAPYCKIYVVSPSGSYRYDWQRHALEQVSREDLTETIPSQSFAKQAPMTLVVVADGRELAAMSSPFGEEFAAVLAGAMSEHVYLAAQALNVGVRLVYSIDRDAAKKGLALADGDTPYFGIVLGKQ